MKHEWPPDLEQVTFYARRDCLNEATLRILIGEDGDAYITVLQDSRGFADARFCTKVGGGKSPRVRQAIINLAEAIRLDNLEDPARAEW